MADGQSDEVSEPVEWIAGAVWLEGLGNLLKGEQKAKHGRGRGDEGREKRGLSRAEGEIAKKREGSHQAEVPDLVAIGDAIDECPPLGALAPIGDADDGDEKRDETKRCRDGKNSFHAGLNDFALIAVTALR